MSDYQPPTLDLSFVLTDVADLDGVLGLPGYEDITADLVESVIEEAGRIAREVLAPLDRSGDLEGARLNEAGVETPTGWKSAYRAFVDGGWNGLQFDDALGGQGLPMLVATAVQELWHGANMSFGLCPMLTQAAVEAIQRHGDDRLRKLYLPHLVSGEWTGTMNLTESQAGSDLSAVRCKAVPEGDHYRLKGQKIFITYGDHDLTENIVHLVLARLPDAPEGVKGISLFLVPKVLVLESGELGEPNDVTCVSLEHKLGIHGSPTAMLSYGENAGAVGYLVGEQNRGLEYMFTMMNLARHAVGVEAYGVAERAYQRAREYAGTRVQGRAVDQRSADRVTIDQHPDVRRMLLTMKCQIEAMRALGCYYGAAFDKAHRHPDAHERELHQALVEVLTPVVKGWSSEVSNQVAGQALQIHGGMGFIEETGAAQHYRDVRITTIYEGTTGIQAADLVNRKLLRDGGAMVGLVVKTIRNDVQSLAHEQGEAASVLYAAMQDAVSMLERATDWVLGSAGEDPRLPLAASFPYLMLWGTVAGGWQMCRAVLAADRRLSAGDGDGALYRDKLAAARFYGLHLLPQASAYQAALLEGTEAILDPDIRFE